jgi:hypothetical protein
MRIYTHVDEESLNNAITGLNRLLGNGRKAANFGQPSSRVAQIGFSG